MEKVEVKKIKQNGIMHHYQVFDLVPKIMDQVKPGIHEPQLQVEWSITFLYSFVVERHS